MGFYKIGKVILRSLFKKPATLMYPAVPRQWQERTRGHIEIDEPNCILCSICARRCPTTAIKVDRPGKTWTIERMACVQCGACVDACPKKCLHMKPEYTPVNTVKVVDTYDIPEQPKPAPKPAATEAPAADAVPPSAAPAAAEA